MSSLVHLVDVSCYRPDETLKLDHAKVHEVFDMVGGTDRLGIPITMRVSDFWCRASLAKPAVLAQNNTSRQH